MRSIHRAVPPAMLACLLLAGCSSVQLGSSDPSSPGGTAATGGRGAGVPGGSRAIAVGAGPQKAYTVQQQPAAGSCHYRYEHGEPL
ncbi:hypothetical protein ACFZA1_37825 [Streptomyces filipinensis]|uniref:hypothetical protein n=1 Tax=Streptomyces filipinensis TaxID=66887 RepID=UPI0036E5C733